MWLLHIVYYHKLYKMQGFVILRHVNSYTTNKYWIECYNCIRTNYPDNKILIIDDNSNYDFVTQIELVNTEIIQSEFPGRGELLPYYYLHSTKIFDKAVVIHDSVFIQKQIDFGDDTKFLWQFEHTWDNIVQEEHFIKQLKNSEPVLDFYRDKTKWKGCFGVMSVISYDVIKAINDKFDFFNLLKFIRCRTDRMCLERIFATLVSYETDTTVDRCSVFGDIHQFCRWGYEYDTYVKEKDKIDRSIVKVWTGRVPKQTICLTKQTVCFYLGYATLANNLYGSELALINIAKHFAISYNVYLVGFEQTGTNRGFQYLNVNDYHEFQKNNTVDVLIISRYINYFIELEMTAKRCYVWLHDKCVHDAWNCKSMPATGKYFVKNVLHKIDGFICLTKWHKNLIQYHYEIPSDKMFIIGNAVSDNFLENTANVKKVKNRFISISDPSRGLNTLIECFLKIRNKIPNAELYVYRGMEEFNTPELKKLLQLINLSKCMHYMGAVSNDQIMLELAKSDVWLYPTHVPESFCTSALEAMAVGCLCITTDMASPTTVVGDRGILLKPPVESDAYKKKCVDTVIEYLLDDDKKLSLQKKAREWASGITWGVRYKDWKKLVFN